MATLYYCKTVEDFERRVTEGEAHQAATLDNYSQTFMEPNSIADPSVIIQRLLTAQNEVETILVTQGFSLSKLRTSTIPFLEDAVAIVAWWHCEIHTGRELVEKKYKAVLYQLSHTTRLITEDGSILSSGELGEVTQVKRKAFVAKRQ